MVIDKSTFAFLKALARNNEREWFQQNRKRYDSALVNMCGWLDELITQMNRHDQLETRNGKEALYRIYNDVRFSTDKTPYNPRFAGRLKRVKPFLRGGYYFWIKPGASRIGCGFTYPNAPDLLRIREDIATNLKDWGTLLRTRKLRSVFGNMIGDQVKTAPKGFARDHPAIDLLRHKQFWFEHAYTDEEVLSPGFLRQVNSDYKAIRPFFDYMTDVLTTNANGERLI
jgi:uncharacterized protein (TIGR02453 family)